MKKEKKSSKRVDTVGTSALSTIYKKILVIII